MPLGLFQILNLLRQRVHFFVFSWAPLDQLDLTGMERMHLDRILIPMAGEPDLIALKEALRERGLESAAPILLVDRDGARAREFARVLDEEGCLNVFYALDGLTGLLAEQSAGGC